MQFAVEPNRRLWWEWRRNERAIAGRLALICSRAAGEFRQVVPREV